MKKIIILVLMFSTFSFYSQNRTISGKVIAEDLEITPGVSITVNDTVEIGQTDINGVFEIQIPVSVNKIVFSAVGMEPAILRLTDNCVAIELVMMYYSHYDFMTLRKVDRLRMKRFKKLPGLHKQAFERGIFTTEKACFLQEFIKYHSKDYK